MQVHPYRPVAIYLRPNYLTRAFTGHERLQCHLHNFTFLCERFSPFYVLDIFAPGADLFAKEQDGASVVCKFSVEQKSPNQGELSLTLFARDEEIYVMSFNFAPGKIFSLPDATVILVTRMQGVAASFDLIRLATKMFADITPQALLFAALQGLAERFAIRHIFGVSAPVQPSFKPENAEQMRRTYDDFFLSVGAALTDRSFYLFDRDSVTSIYDNMPAKHRARTKTKRRLKAALASQVAQRLTLYAAPAARGERTTHFVAAQFYTNAGERRGNLIETTGQAGCLLHGPYIYLEAGAYLAAHVLAGDGDAADIVIDVTADRGRTELARKRLDGWRHGDPVEIAFETKQPYDEIEFRLFVQEGAKIVARGVQLRASPAVPPA